MLQAHPIVQDLQKVKYVVWRLKSGPFFKGVLAGRYTYELQLLYNYLPYVASASYTRPKV